MTALQELQNYTFVSKYARWLPEEKRRETWKEAVDRVCQMMLEKYENKGIREQIVWAYDLMYKKRVLGSQRALQFGGKPILQHNTRMYNCSASYCDRLRFFQEVFFVLLCGSGVGYSIQKHHINKLPNFSQQRLDPKHLLHRSKPNTFVIPDSIEGWADSIGVLLTSFLTTSSEKKFDKYLNKNIVFDYSQIRPKGAPLSSSSGRAPGPEPLKKAHEQVLGLLNRCIKNEQTCLRPIDAHDIICHIADSVLSGGVRRSSLLAIFSKFDEEMLTAKTGNWFIDNPQRARSNNSVILLRDKVTFEEFKELLQYSKVNGEPGFQFADSYEQLVNPCSEIGLYAKDGNMSGFEFCNLSSINCGNLKDEKDFCDRCKAAAIIGTLQGGFNEFPYLGQTTENIVRKEALIGVSLMGTMENTEITLNPRIQRRGANIVREVNREIAQAIGIRQAARCTTLKPSGTSSCLLGICSGIHPHHAKRYLRRVQNNKIEIPYQYFKKTNTVAIEKSVWNTGDENIIFPIEVADGSKLKNQLPALEMLKIIKQTQENWINHGKNSDLCVKPWLNHSVSNTITVKANEWNEVTRYVYRNRHNFTCVSFLSDTGDKDSPQSPFTAVYTSHEIVREYGDAAVWCSGLIELALQAFDGSLWTACDYALKGEITPYPAEEDLLIFAARLSNIALKTRFVGKFRKYAKRYFEKNELRLSYCLKDVFNWKQYQDLQIDFKPVDYTKMTELEDNTTLEQEIACGGGACEI